MRYDAAGVLVTLSSAPTAVKVCVCVCVVCVRMRVCVCVCARACVCVLEYCSDGIADAPVE